MKLAELSPVELPSSDLPEDIYIGSNLLSSVQRITADCLKGEYVILADEHTIDACGASDWSCEKIILGSKPIADTETVNQVVAALTPNQHLLAMGSGTINDLAKRASTLVQRPYVCVGTAASMNGYASGIAAILDNGLKTTVPARPPQAIILDTEVLAKAPFALTQAGLGDLISKPVSDTDWWLADQLGESTYSELPNTIVSHAIERASSEPEALKAHTPSAHGALGEALVLSGVAMVVAGSSSPASGGEHLISHLWDMENLHFDRPKFLHGAQVGLTTCLSAALYQMILNLDSPNWQHPVTPSEERRRLMRDHPALSSTIESQALAKHHRAVARMERLMANWGEIRAGLQKREIPPPTYFQRILSAIDAPRSFEAFNLTRQDLRRTLSVAKDIRNRYTVLDLATDLGILPESAERVLQTAGL